MKYRGLLPTYPPTYPPKRAAVSGWVGFLFGMFLPSIGWAQHVNPDPGDVWTYQGPTLGGGWGSPTANAMSRSAANASLPSAPNNLLGNSVAHTYFAKAYGSCSWATDGSGDNSVCILTAIAAAKLDVILTGGFQIGGGEVVLPAGDIGISSTILQNSGPGIVIRGAGAPGNFGYCKTRLRWTGSAGGTMVQFGDDSTGIVVSGGLKDLCIDGKTDGLGTGAATGVKLRSAAWGNYENVFVHNVQTLGWDLDVSAVGTQGLSQNRFHNTSVTLQTAGAINAGCWKIGPGTASQDTFANEWLHAQCQYQNGIGWDIGNSDTNFFRDIWGQAILGGTGRSLICRGGELGVAGPFNLSECRENFIEGYFGNSTGSTAPQFAAGTVQAVVTASQTAAVVTVTGVTSGTLAVGQTLYGTSMPVPARITSFGTGTGGTGTYNVNVSQTAASDTVSSSYPSLDNRIHLMGMGSGALLPSVGSAVTLTYESDRGDYFSNATNAVSGGFKHGGMSYKGTPGTTTGVFDIDTPNSSNFAVAAKFGSDKPIYLNYGNPSVSFNSYWNGSSWRYGKGSSSSYGGRLNYSTTNGAFTFLSTTGTGNADAALSGDTQMFAVDRFGHQRISGLAAPALTSCGTTPAISGDDRAGEVTMGTGSPTGCVITFANAYTSVPYCVVTWQATPLASQSYTVSATALTLTQTGTSSNKVNYNCAARSGG